MARGRNLQQRVDANLQALKNWKQEAPTASNDQGTACAQALASCSNDASVQKACEIAGLDHNDPCDRDKLLVAFASARFDRKSAGAPTRWTTLKLWMLATCYMRLVLSHPGSTDEEICELMCHGSYRRFKPTTLLRVLQDALDPTKVEVLRDVLASFSEEQIRIINERRRHRPLPDWRTLPDRFDEYKKAVSSRRAPRGRNAHSAHRRSVVAPGGAESTAPAGDAAGFGGGAGFGPSADSGGNAGTGPSPRAGPQK